MVKGILIHGVKIWDGSNSKKLKGIKEKYIEWVLKMGKKIPSYMCSYIYTWYVCTCWTWKNLNQKQKQGKVIKKKEENSPEKICWGKKEERK